MGSVGDLEPNPPAQLVRQLATRELDHPLGDIYPDHLGLREAAGNRERGSARAGAEIECTLRRRLDLLERGLVRRVAGVRGAERVPLRRQAIELEPHRAAE